MKPVLAFYLMYWGTTSAVIGAFLVIFGYGFLVKNAALAFSNPWVGVPTIAAAALVPAFGLYVMSRAVNPDAWLQVASGLHLRTAAAVTTDDRSSEIPVGVRTPLPRTLRIPSSDAAPKSS